MNKVLMSLSLSAFILSGICFAQTPPTTDNSSTAAPAATTPTVIRPVHHVGPITKAKHRLILAKQSLEDAPNNYGGHKAQAIADINLALIEVQACLDFNKTVIKQ